MDDINRSISNYIKSGEYYKDARSWYANRFLRPMSEKAYLLLLICFYLLVLSISGYYYYNTNPADPEVTYMLPSDDISKTYLVIKPAGNYQESPQIDIDKYLVANYVTQREAYIYGDDEQKNQLNFVRNTTVGTEYLKYKDMISDTNPDSPALIYLDKYRKTIKVVKTNITKIAPGIQQGMVYFQANLRNVASNQVISKDFVATVRFKVDNIKTLIGTEAKKVGFLVTGYSIKEVTKKGE